jgi:DNA-binding beta-propeller fold protein YncE
MNRRSLTLSALVLILIFLSSCAPAPKPVIEAPVFYPDPPEPPRIQFLKSLKGAADVERKKSAFWAFVTGTKGGATTLDKPYGIAGYQGKIYVCDTNATVMVFDFEKNTFGPIQGAQGMGKLMQPFNISIDKDGNKFVSDPVRGQVVMFDKNDFYVKAFGPLEGWKPVDAAPYGGLLYVADIKDGEIKVFDIQSGALQTSFGKKGDEASKLGLPTNLAFDSSGYLYASDAGRFQIVKLDRDGNSRGVLGSLGSRPGFFARPKGIAIDRQDRLYVVDAAFSTIQMFNKDSQLLLFFGKAGIKPGDLYLAAKVAIDYDDIKYFQQYAAPDFQIEYLILVTNQFGNQMVNVYGFGTQKGRTYPTDQELKKQIEEKRQKELKEQKEHPEIKDKDDGGKKEN